MVITSVKKDSQQLKKFTAIKKKQYKKVKNN